MTGIIRAAAGKGAGSSVPRASVQDDVNIMETMYYNKSKDKDEIATEEKQQLSLRKKNAQKLVDSYYNIVTDFYEAGWGQSFHFAPRAPHETFRESIIRFEHFIALKLNISPNDKVLDLGCGIGGPMRNVSLFTGANVIGVTINQYQVNRGNEINQSNIVHAKKCKLIQDDFCKLSNFGDNTFDKIFAIESTCHAPNRGKVFEQVLRVLKPGGLFISSEWVLKDDKYDPNNKEHKLLKKQIETGNALPDLVTDKQVLESFEKCGFNIIESIDLDRQSRNEGQIAWYKSLEFEFSSIMETIQHCRVATYFTSWLTWILEGVKLAPQGTHNAHELLLVGRDGLIKGGETEAFTPYFIVLTQKPAK